MVLEITLHQVPGTIHETEGKTNEVGMNTVACPDTQQSLSFPFQDDE